MSKDAKEWHRRADDGQDIGPSSLQSAAVSAAQRPRVQQHPHQHRQIPRSQFLPGPEPFPTASKSNSDPRSHLHDAYGDDDSGVDYGPPNEFELGSSSDDEDEEDGGEVAEEKEVPAMRNVIDETPGRNNVGDPEGDRREAAVAAVMTDRAREMTTADSTFENSTAKTSDATTKQRTITIEELEESVGLHETTLESLNTKLQTLNGQIQHEQTTSSSLRNGIHDLNERKDGYKKRTDNNLRLVGELEISLERCLERLRRALDGLAEVPEREEMGEVDIGGDDGEDSDGISDADGEGGGSVGNDDAVDAAESDDGGNDRPIREEDAGDAPHEHRSQMATTADEDATSEYRHVDIPLNPDYENSRGRIAWPSPDLARQIQNKANGLPCHFPSWRARPLSSPLLRGIDSKKLIVDVMNAAVLELLLEREERQKQQGQLLGGGVELPSNCGWVDESDVWGTSLDVYAQLNWEDVFSGLRRADESVSSGDGAAVGRPMESSRTATTSGIDPNIILCPYELGGKCADDQCPYQHLRQGDNNNNRAARAKRVLVSATDDSYVCYLRYNNPPKTKLPRPFSRHDFIIAKTKIDAVHGREEVATHSLSSAGNNNNNGELPSDGRLYHCPVCLDNRTRNQEELKSHLKECNSQSNMTIDGKAVAIRHVLRDREVVGGVGANMSSQGSALDSSSDSDGHSMSDDNDDERPGGQADKFEGEDGVENPAIYTGEPSEHFPDFRENCVEANLDFVSLPAIAESVHGDSSHSPGDSKRLRHGKAIFEDRFWWQQLDSFMPSPDIIEGGEHDTTFDHVLHAFDFQRLHIYDGKGGNSHSLRYVMRTPPDSTSSTSSQEQIIIEEVLLFVRLIDLTRILVHMGRDSFALSAIRSITQSRANDFCRVLLDESAKLIDNLSRSRGSLAIFEVQAHLLVVSEACCYTDSLCGENTAGNDLCLDTLLDQISCLKHPEKFKENKLLPVGFDAMIGSLKSRLESPSADGGGDDLEAFVKTLRLMIEKFIVIPFSQIRTDQQLALLMQCICIGKSFGHFVGDALKEHRRFVSPLHILEPIWSSLQPLLHASATLYDQQGCELWLKPDTIALVVLGPVIFGCVADVIAPLPEVSQEFLPPQFDARALAEVSSLDKFILGIFKELSRFGRQNDGGFIELLLAPLYALSATICIALGSFEKARVRLENVLNKDAGSNAVAHPSIYALSEMIWSQLVQLYIICPSYSVPLIRTDNTRSLADATLVAHEEVASRIVGNGIFLWGVKLRGDSHMNIRSPCLNHMHCKEWGKAAKIIFMERPPIEADAETTPQQVEFVISKQYSEVDGVKSRASVFPESLLLLGKAMTKLSLENCGLTRLPLSIGYHLANLQVLNLSNNRMRELPSSIGFMTCLEVLNVSCNRLCEFPKLSRCSNLRVIDVSHNQLASFPAHLALQCQNLQSFIVEGNPASADVLPPPQKRQKLLGR